MKTNRKDQRKEGMTTIEVLAVVFVLVIAAGFLLPAVTRPRGCRAQRINCISNLKQIGLAMRMWSNDHGEKFPWSVSTNEGGTLEFANTTAVFRHYLALSNELVSPKVLVCRSDYRRTRASSWDQFTNNKTHLSYFIGLAADETRPQMILSGDRNLTFNGRLTWGLVSVPSNAVFGVAPLLHTNYVNVGLADGSANQVPAAELKQLNGAQFASITNQSVLFVIP